MMPYSIRCLRAIETFIGGRDVLSEKLGVSVHAINRWVVERKIPGKAILALKEIGKDKFTCEELLGKYDDDY